MLLSNTDIKTGTYLKHSDRNALSKYFGQWERYSHNNQQHRIEKTENVEQVLTASTAFHNIIIITKFLCANILEKI